MEDSKLYTLVTVKRSRGGVVERECRKGQDIAVKSQFGVRENDFLISKRQIVHGACGVVPKALNGAVVSNEYAVLQCKEPLDLRFLNYLSHTVYFQQTCFHSSTGVHIEKMIFKLSDWYKWPIDIPQIEKQKKIADSLTTIDSKLTALGRKRDLLQTYKRGMMQKLFSQALRFKADDGSGFPKWKEQRLGDVGFFRSGVGFPESEQGGVDGIPFYKVSDMNLKGNEKEMQLANNYVTTDQVSKLKVKPFPRFSIIFAKVGAAVFLERKRYAMNFLIDNNMMAFTPGDVLVNDFCMHLFERTRLSRFAQVGALPSLTASDLGAIKVHIPTRPEQQKIANFLTALDTKIDAVDRQIEGMETFKKGLLQKLFV